MYVLDESNEEGHERRVWSRYPISAWLAHFGLQNNSVLDADTFVWDSAPMSQQEQESSLFPQVCFRRSVTCVVTFHPILFTLLWPSAILWDRTGVSKLVGKGRAQNILGSVAMRSLLSPNYSILITARRQPGMSVPCANQTSFTKIVGVAVVWACALPFAGPLRKKN